MRPRRGKFNAEPMYVQGIRFASKREARAYQELRLREMAGEIEILALQPRYPLAAATGEVVCHYVGDFEIRDCRTGEERVIDAKGMKTPVYRLKKKLWQAQYAPRTIEEV